MNFAPCVKSGFAVTVLSALLNSGEPGSNLGDLGALGFAGSVFGTNGKFGETL
ncbi:hypothetical protein D3C86_1921320 [compost metagenome]